MKESTELRKKLKIIDEKVTEVSNWEADFLESVVYQQSGKLSEKQKVSAMKIVEKYSSEAGI